MPGLRQSTKYGITCGRVVKKYWYLKTFVNNVYLESFGVPYVDC